MEEWHPCFDVAGSPQHLSDLELAHSSSSDTSLGDPISQETLEKMRLAAARSFAQWPTEDQVEFLSDLPAGEVALILKRLDTQMRDDLLLSLPSYLHQALDELREAGLGTAIST